MCSLRELKMPAKSTVQPRTSSTGTRRKRIPNKRRSSLRAELSQPPAAGAPSSSVYPCKLPATDVTGRQSAERLGQALSHAAGQTSRSCGEATPSPTSLREIHDAPWARARRRAVCDDTAAQDGGEPLQTDGQEAGAQVPSCPVGHHAHHAPLGSSRSLRVAPAARHHS